MSRDRNPFERRVVPALAHFSDRQLRELVHDGYARIDRGWVVPVVAGGASAFVQAFTIRTNASNVTNPHTFTLSANPAASSVIAVFYCWNGTGTMTGAGSFTDAKGNTWNFVRQQLQTTGGRTAIGCWWTTQNVGALTTADNISATMSLLGTTNDRIAIPIELTTVTALDASAGGNDSVVDSTLVSTGVSTVAAQTIAFNSFGINTTTVPITGFSPDTERVWTSATFGGDARSVALEYIDLSAASVLAPSGAAYTGGVAATSMNLIVSFVVTATALARPPQVLGQAVKRGAFF